MKREVLLVEDDDAFAYALAERLRRDGHAVRTCCTSREAFEILCTHAPGLMVIDYQLPDGTALDVLGKLSDDGPSVMMITAFGSIDGAVEAMRRGCVDYVAKEAGLDDIALRVERAFGVVELRDRVNRYEEVFARGALGGIDGESRSIQAVREQIAAAASAPDTTVLIQGESGTGKQLVARAVHHASARRDRPYVEIDCTTLAAGILESELFGHERGAFTGADQRKHGLVETATGGTLLLDEIGELDASAQGKLLRLLQERRFRRVGGVQDRDVDVRIIAATNRDLQAEVEAKKFREDLYYRLRVLVIGVPPLRDRGEDVLLLADRFMHELGRRLNKPDLRLSGEARAQLKSYAFPGNVRELRGTLEQAIVRLPPDKKEIAAGLLFPDQRRRQTPRKRGRPRKAILREEARQIREAMERHFGNQSKAAEELGISRFALKRKLEQLLGEEV